MAQTLNVLVIYEGILIMKLSIIVPCYNVATFLNRGLRSLSNQSLRDIEIICIDDKSTDNTLAVLQAWAKCDLRIRVLANKKNMGVAKSRNRGIDSATGEYIGFMDPDDYVDPDFFERLVKLADTTDSQVACGQLCVNDIDGRSHYDPYRSVSELKRTLHNFKYHYTAVYRRDFLNAHNIRYPNLSINEDSVFETMVKCAMTTNLPLAKGTYYYYCRRADSLNADWWPETKIKESVTGVEMIIDIYNAAPVNAKDYICGAYGYLNYLRDVTLIKNTKTQLFVAENMCRIFKKMKYKQKLNSDNSPLYLALLNEDAHGVIDVINAQKWRTRTYKIFGSVKFMTVAYTKVRKDVRIFGLLVYRMNLT